MGRVTRRIFLGLGVAAAGGLAVGTWWVRAPHDNPLEDGLAEGETTFNPWLKIGADGTITVIVPRAEMGQGVTTTLAALVAEELEVSLEAVTVVPGPADPAYHNAALLAKGAAKPWATSWTAELARAAAGTGAKGLGLQITGGSTSTIDAFDKMRTAGATARVQLIRAAAARWGMEPAGLRAEDGAVLDPGSDRRLAYGPLAAARGHGGEVLRRADLRDRRGPAGDAARHGSDEPALRRRGRVGLVRRGAEHAGGAEGRAALDRVRRGLRRDRHEHLGGLPRRRGAGDRMGAGR